MTFTFRQEPVPFAQGSCAEAGQFAEQSRRRPLALESLQPHHSHARVEAVIEPHTRAVEFQQDSDSFGVL